MSNLPNFPAPQPPRVPMDTDFIEIRFGSYGLLVVWGPYGQFKSAIFTSLEP